MAASSWRRCSKPRRRTSRFTAAHPGCALGHVVIGRDETLCADEGKRLPRRNSVFAAALQTLTYDRLPARAKNL
jgi:hypothetical protein